MTSQPLNPEEFTARQNDVLDSALEALLAGHSVATILAQYPAEAHWLAPLLTIAAELEQHLQQQAAKNQHIATHRAAKAKSLARLLAHRAHLQTTSPAKPARWVHLPGLPWVTRLGLGLATLLLLVVVSFGLNTVAQNSLPGEAFYPLKQLSEQAQWSYVNLIEDEAAQHSFNESLNQRRIAETKALLAAQQEAAVKFIAQVDSLSETELTTQGISVIMTERTHIDGRLSVNSRIEIEGVTTQSQQLIAESITVLVNAEPTPTPTPTVSPTASPSPTATLNPLPATINPQNSPSLWPNSPTTPQLTATPQPTATPSLSPATATPSRTPSATPTPSRTPTQITPAQTATSRPERPATSTATPLPSATATTTPTASPTVSPSPTASPSPTTTPAPPTNTPTLAPTNVSTGTLDFPTAIPTAPATDTPPSNDNSAPTPLPPTNTPVPTDPRPTPSPATTAPPEPTATTNNPTSTPSPLPSPPPTDSPTP